MFPLMNALALHALLCATPPAARTPDAPESLPSVMWIELAPKTLPKRALRASDTPLTERALARRAKFRTDGKLIDARDVPIAAPRINAIRATGAKVRAESRWLNAVSVVATREQLDAIAALPFVQKIKPLHPSQRVEPVEPESDALMPEGSVSATNYGFMTDQLMQITVPTLHTRGFHGEGMVIGVLDTGFHRVHEAFHSLEYPLDVIAEWDFVSNDANTGIDVGDHAEQHKHGTWILGTLAAYLPGTAVGSAYAAKFILAKTEDYANEVPIEEDYYVAGLEFIEANGADLATSSLGYIDWYTPEDLDGVTAITTQAVNIATANGLVCLTAAGNAGHDADSTTNHIIAPADAFQVITCGAANAAGAIASFSSDGPSADGRVKPEVLARGVSVVSVHSTNTSGLQAVSGTSLSTPLIAGATALLMQARSDLSVDGIRDALFTTASRSVSGVGADPLFVEGFGMISARAAAMKDRAAEDIDLDGAVGASDLSLLLASWGPCSETDPVTGLCPTDLDGDGVIGASDLARILDAWGR